MNLQFFIPGTPRPGGSKRGFAFRRKNGSLGVALADAGGDKVREWRAVVADCARQAMAGNQLTDAALQVRFTFVMLRPKGHFRTGKNSNVLRDSAPRFPTGKPDVLKLSRSTEDAMTGIVWRDDAATVELFARKVYGDAPGCMVAIEAVTE